LAASVDTDGDGPTDDQEGFAPIHQADSDFDGQAMALKSWR
jgi:hypothetical protein